jgi:hypothetical protein
LVVLNVTCPVTSYPSKPLAPVCPGKSGFCFSSHQV